jgi:hypothetical protein
MHHTFFEQRYMGNHSFMSSNLDCNFKLKPNKGARGRRSAYSDSSPVKLPFSPIHTWASSRKRQSTASRTQSNKSKAVPLVRWWVASRILPTN